MSIASSPRDALCVLMRAGASSAAVGDSPGGYMGGGVEGIDACTA